MPMYATRAMKRGWRRDMGDRDEMQAPYGIRTVRPRWGGAILLCGKCLKRHPDGSDLRRAIKTEARRRVEDDGSKRKVKVLKISCIGLCPRRAIVAASSATLCAGEVLLVRQVADAPEAVSRLLPADRRA